MASGAPLLVFRDLSLLHRLNQAVFEPSFGYLLNANYEAVGSARRGLISSLPMTCLTNGAYVDLRASHGTGTAGRVGPE